MNIKDYDNIIPDIIYFIHRKCLPKWEIEQRVTDCIDVLYVLKGVAIYTIDQKDYTISPGSLLCIPMGKLRSAVTVPENPMECYSVSFRLKDSSCEETLHLLPLVSHIGIHSDIISLYRDLNSAWLHREPGYILKSRAMLMLILQSYFELLVFKNSPTFIDARINKAIRYITDHYSEEIGLHDLSKITNLNAAYFGVLFKQSIGMTFRQFITSVRLNHAESMLKSGEYNVTEAAVQCGFSDIGYFWRVYKKSRGISPSKVFRQSMTQNDINTLFQDKSEK